MTKFWYPSPEWIACPHRVKEDQDNCGKAKCEFHNTGNAIMFPSGVKGKVNNNTIHDRYISVDRYFTSSGKIDMAYTSYPPCQLRSNLTDNDIEFYTGDNRERTKEKSK